MVEFLQNWGGLILSGVSVIIAVISIIQSSKAQKLQNKINELDTKIKEYELEKIEKEKTEASSSVIKARAINVGKNSYRLKIYNAGNTTAYNISAQISNEYCVMLINDKMPFEELEPQNGFDEVLIVHMGSARKFKVELTWQDKDGNEHKDEQFCSI
ncbi:MAG: hypothetical protein IKA54_04090 [Clostridia bacterium]|nr:hypothetical protein [Clostridia bacterium]